MALAASHHGLLPFAPAATPTPSRGHLRFRAARPLPRPARRICCQSINSANVLGASSTTSDEAVPVPVVQIDQDSDRDATIVQLSFGDRLGALLDTMKALKDLGLDVTKGSVTTDSAVTQTKFHIMRFGRKVEDPDMLERIRLTIINNLLQYHPESSEKLAMGEFFGIKPPEKKASAILILYIETADRPGLLLEIIKIIADTNIDVESAEIDTEGLVAKDKFHALTNCLRYYLRRPETDEDSY
ncbi:ACT domain-containing protein ACR12 [Zea mays]|uniref:ACT domain-containing protein ACR n=1 Tax=Zea mays TaxID=4577 RepID=A0A1D6NQX1_MAIZE|nr:ACT domain-containing protein ACR12 [Zea mays]